jgi:nucleoside-triphosphatase THEP1
VFAVVVTGAPGSGKSVCLMALSDALVDDEIAHATIDVDEVAWAYPFPDEDQRRRHLSALWESHRRAGHDLVLVSEVVESAAELADVLARTRA